MKGKNKLVFVMFAMMALVATGVCFAFMPKRDKINYVTATAMDDYTAELDGGIIFSAEKVYFASDFKSNGGVSLKYNGDDFKRVETGYKNGDEDAGTRYFADAGEIEGSGSNSTKVVIRDGGFVMVDNTEGGKANAKDGANEDVAIEQGIMITLGGYYRNASKAIVTNETTGTSPIVENGANMSYVKADAKLNGISITDTMPSPRSFRSGTCEDFTWFIPATEDTEGHYEITFIYMIENEIDLRFDFDFYLLLTSEYEGVETVNGREYPCMPTLSKSSHLLGSDTFPTLTFDYTRYTLEITHSASDVTKTIELSADLISKRVLLTTTIHNDIETVYYPMGDFDNNIITLMFADNGKYTFKFKYIYDYFGQRIVIPKEQISVEDLKLSIHGYQFKYSKAGVNSADMEYLEIAQNNTMFILLNGFTNASGEKSSANLGINYKIVPSTTLSTGDIIDRENAVLNLDASTTLDEMIEAEADDSDNTALDDLLSEEDLYEKTDRGIWLSLNDTYHLDASFYYYTEDKNQMTAAYLIDEDNQKQFTKVTTFTKPGYYLVQVAYKYGASNENTGYQFFAFEITSATPILNLYKTTAGNINNVVLTGVNKNTYEFYAYEYTNQDVYGTWDDPARFESSIKGKLYYTKDKYRDESELRAAADRGIDSSIVKKDYTKGTFIKDSAAYLLVLEVGGTATKTYTYFTIDKDKISGLKVHEVVTGSIDNYIYYQVKTINYQYVTHTDKAVIDVDFALDWDPKPSKAKISARYKYTPFVGGNTYKGKPAISESSDSYYKYVLNNYTLGTSTGFIEFEWIDNDKNMDKGADNLSSDNVMIDQGIYQFELEDQAGNKLNYIMILDRTEGMITATYGDADATGSKNTYTSGQLVADYVEMDWGTHKSIDVSGATGDSAVALLLELAKNKESDEDLFKHYNSEKGNNLKALTSLFKNDIEFEGSLIKDVLVIENQYANIKITPYSEGDSYYKLKSVAPSSNPNNPENDYKATINGSGIEYVGWSGEKAKVLVTTLQGVKYTNISKTEEFEYTGTNSDLKICVDPDFLTRYMIEIKGVNNVGDSVDTKFSAYISPDKTLGQVYSAVQDGAEYQTRVEVKGQNSALNTTEHDIYHEAQASDDGVFVYEWTNLKSEDPYEVVSISYDYYQLMDQSSLNGVTGQVNSSSVLANYYYPYKYVRSQDILKLEDQEIGGTTQSVLTVQEYDEVSRVRENEQTAVDVNRSKPINVGYETYYEDKNLVTRRVTQTGLYIITRTLRTKAQTGPSIASSGGASTATMSSFSYAFFVDRNMIIGYDINDIKLKLVGQFIHLAMPNSDGEQEVQFDNFTKQGVDSVTITDTKLNKTVSANIYLETNKLPTRLNVPSGKYVTGQIEDGKIGELQHTSNRNMYLSLTVYFKDTYGILGRGYTGWTVKIIDNHKVNSVDGGYIDFKLKADDDMVRAYSDARRHSGNSNLLTLPGTYIFVIMDKVGKKVDNISGEVTDVNEYPFAIKLIKDAPKADVYTYAEIDDNKSDKIYSEDLVLYTNQEYVDFVIPKENKNSYLAQLDIAKVVVRRNDLSVPWLTLNYNHSAGGEMPTVGSGFVTKIDGVVESAEDGSGWVVKLDATVKVDDNGNIISYNEYVYTISIEYILDNSGYEYYTYMDSDGKLQSFYSTIYTVYIDRTPNDTNLTNILKDQEAYFKEYQGWLAGENGTSYSADSKINDKFAYRDAVTVSDYYALTNKMYYEYVNKGGNLSDQAMYAITINDQTEINTSGLKELYYRQIELDVDGARTRMGLLPILKEYYETDQYFGFSEAIGVYTRTTVESVNNKTYKGLVKLEDPQGKMYEIVEIDLAGNYTQYVVYFTLKDPLYKNAQITINALPLDGNKYDDKLDVAITLGADVTKSFINYQYVAKVDHVAKELDGYEDSYYPYYGKFDIYGGNNLSQSKTIYLNAATINNGADKGNYSNSDDISSILNNLLNAEGNYTIKYTDVYGKSITANINVYLSDEHSLNTDMFNVKQNADGEYYLAFSELNSRVGSAWWYVTQVEVSYSTIRDNAIFDAELIQGIDGRTVLRVNPNSVIDENVLHLSSIPNEKDRLYLKENMSYIVKVTDVAGIVKTLAIFTIKDYISHKLTTVGKGYSRDNVVYTANDVRVEYDKDVYVAQVTGYDISGNIVDDDIVENWYSENNIGNLLLLADDDTGVNDGSYRRLEVQIILKETVEPSVTYKVVIDTRATSFSVYNLNMISCLDNIKSVLNNGGFVDSNNNPIDDYSDDETDLTLLAPEYYGKLINETVNISWTPPVESDYFSYTYQLFEFQKFKSENDETIKMVELLNNPTNLSYPLSPRDGTTGKYIFKVTITAENGMWIASRVYGISMSTTVTGLYKVTYTDGTLRDYSAITNLNEIFESVGIDYDNREVLASKLGFVKTDIHGDQVADVESLNKALESFGYTTAIPLYIANEPLELQSNKDKGVDALADEYVLDHSGTKIWFYRIWRSNYQTFAVLMQVRDTRKASGTSGILSEFKFYTSSEKFYDLTLSTSKRVYDPDAQYYRLNFNSYYTNCESEEATILEKYNKIKITFIYSGSEVNTIVGDNSREFTSKEFSNSGNYTLKVTDMAGNVQRFQKDELSSETFKLVLMKRNEIIYTMTTDESSGGKAPIKYAYYDKAVTLNIEYSQNYESNISVQVYRNSMPYSGYDHPIGSGIFRFNEYGTYLVRVTAYILKDRNEVIDDEDRKVTSEIVFTIINPNEARRALDFTSIYGYEIIKVESINDGNYKDVTEKFMSLLNDKANSGSADEYNKLITYERVLDVFGSSGKRKMMFKVQYKVQDDELLPARYEEFSFTLNNQTATLSASIEPGGKTTKPVIIKFNPKNIYDLVGDCCIYVNGAKTDNRITKDTPNSVIEFPVSAVGEYYIQLVGDSGTVITTFNFTIKEPMNTVSIILIVVVSALVIGLVGTFIWLRTRMKVR